MTERDQCTFCNTDLGKKRRFMACDVTMHHYCTGCWPRSACAKGKHGEGCPTSIFQDDEEIAANG